MFDELTLAPKATVVSTPKLDFHTIFSSCRENFPVNALVTLKRQFNHSVMRTC